MGATIFIGYSDGGQIDVSARVAEQRNLAGANYANNNPDGSVTVPVQNSAPPVVTHSQLRPRGMDVTKLPPASEGATATTTETSKEEATTTEAIDEDSAQTEALNEPETDSVTGGG